MATKSITVAIIKHLMKASAKKKLEKAKAAAVKAKVDEKLKKEASKEKVVHPTNTKPEAPKQKQTTNFKHSTSKKDPVKTETIVKNEIIKPKLREGLPKYPASHNFEKPQVAIVPKPEPKEKHVKPATEVLEPEPVINFGKPAETKKETPSDFKFGKVYQHDSGEHWPHHKGPVRVIIQFKGKNVVVEPLDKEGQGTGKAFPAKPEHLTY